MTGVFAALASVVIEPIIELRAQGNFHSAAWAAQPNSCDLGTYRTCPLNRGHCVEEMKAVIFKSAISLALGLRPGRAFGPKALVHSHVCYNDAVKLVTEEQLLLNLVRLRYNDDPMRLDYFGDCRKYELAGNVEARPFFSLQKQHESQIRPFMTLSPPSCLSRML